MRPSLAALMSLALTACGHTSCGEEPATGSSGAVTAEPPPVLGEAPMCEASAVVQAPWDATRLLVADNEIHDRLFLYRAEGDRLVSAGTAALPPGGPHDIEALAVRGGDLWVIGSHSRNKECEVRENRKRVLVLRWEGSLMEQRRFVSDEPSWSSSVDRCMAEHFAVPAPPLGAALCTAIVRAASGPSPEGCGTLNIEGAADLGEAGLWLGLRAPLLDGHAVLVRVHEGTASLRFDRVAQLDLDGRGVRGLTADGSRLLIIAGPTVDRVEPHLLFEVDRSALAAGDQPAARRLPLELPASSEGLARLGDQAFAVIDGAEGTRHHCRKPARQVRVTLP